MGDETKEETRWKRRDWRDETKEMRLDGMEKRDYRDETRRKRLDWRDETGKLKGLKKVD